MWLQFGCRQWGGSHGRVVGAGGGRPVCDPGGGTPTATPTPSGTKAPTDTTDTDSGFPWWPLALLLVVALLAGGYLRYRQRRQ